MYTALFMIAAVFVGSTAFAMNDATVVAMQLHREGAATQTVTDKAINRNVANTNNGATDVRTKERSEDESAK